ncbi:MAG: Verru_Chthon cassette protein C [Opitutaceae bacterium]|nr:Verru_Chthon cassette protein C [Verrucomicrobiales bacterium]
MRRPPPFARPSQLNRLPLSKDAYWRERRGFTLVELLVSMAVLSIFLVVLLMLTDISQKLWRRTSSSIQMFERARASFDVITRRLSQATVSTYLDYYDSSGARRNPTSTTFVPSSYGRASDLHFRSGVTSAILGSGIAAPTHGAFFFAPLGFTDNNASYRDLPNLVNPVGYFVEFANDASERPAFLQSAGLPDRYRYRLIEVVQPAQDFKGYPALTDTDLTNDSNWLTEAGGLKASTFKHTLAENIIAFVVRPELSERDAAAAGLPKPWNLTDGYSYNSRAGKINAKDKMQFAQLPPLVRVSMVAVDENVAARLTTGSTPPAVFDTSSLFLDPDKFDADLQTLEASLSAARVQFRTFSSVISLRAAKWSQAN